MLISSAFEVWSKKSLDALVAICAKDAPPRTNQNIFHDQLSAIPLSLRSLHATAAPINIGANVAVRKGALTVLNHKPILFRPNLNAIFNAEVLLPGIVFHWNCSSSKKLTYLIVVGFTL